MRRPTTDDQGAVEWIGASAARRADALEDLLSVADALPQGLRPKGAPSLVEKVVAVHRALDGAGLPHAIGGALAYAYYGEPRTTVDIDVNVFVSAFRLPEIRDALGPLGVDVEIEPGESFDRDHEVRLPWDRNTVHVFFSSDALHASMPAKIRLVPFAGGSIPIVSPEHLLVRKATLDRPKDWLDIEAMLVATESLGLEEIGSWIRELAGSNDPRVAKFRDLARRSCT